MDAMTFPVALRGAASTLMWAHEYEVDAQALNQLRNIDALPWVHGVRVMPDVHLGKGATVGSVIAMRQAVSPAAVGVDIGCGMEGVRTSLTAADLPDDLARLRSRIEAAVPVGFRAHDEPVDVKRLRVGSGSRNIGKELAERHMSIARSLSHNQALPDKDLAVFLAGTPQMDAYRRDLEWAQEYAARSRAVMLALVSQVVSTEFPQAAFDTPVSCHHNYVREEVIEGEPMLVTRKGAIRAGAGDLGLIPGSMGTGSYVVRGLGSAASFWSASHGAGRRMSRSKAKQTFTVADLATQTAGVECRKDQGVVDEIPGAYKNLEDVISAQADLVEVVQRLRTIVCVKG